ncbi:hypothetical protein [Streptomyces noursei]|uniref:hypothetical protein n=1 Tax=Streptomyces noursei TaxID=1971 RepID=UPI0023B7E004|nr:hypothetical protein [Streptomyces noursei]
MIAAKDGHLASFNVGAPTYHTLPVAAWNDDGEPLVVGKGGLTAAWSLPGYHGVIDTTSTSIVAAVPGGGWLIDS